MVVMTETAGGRARLVGISEARTLIGRRMKPAKNIAYQIMRTTKHFCVAQSVLYRRKYEVNATLRVVGSILLINRNLKNVSYFNVKQQ